MQLLFNLNMEYYVICLFAALFSGTLSAPRPSVSKVYRSDYEYNPRTDAFYKLHTERRQGWEVKKVCEVEGATLMLPASPHDIAQVHGMFKRYPDLGNYVLVAADGGHHKSAEETVIIDLSEPEDDVRYGGLFTGQQCDVLTRAGEVESYGCFRSAPFVCKVEAKNAPYDSHCDVFGTNYHYNASVGSCYRIPPRGGSWNEAYAECRADRAHLVVVNSKAEQAALMALMKKTLVESNVQASWFFFVGFRAVEPVVNGTVIFKTIFNQTLEEAGFVEWSDHEPNNSGGKEFCGTLFKNDGKFNDVRCDHLYPYICEKEVNKQT